MLDLESSAEKAARTRKSLKASETCETCVGKVNWPERKVNMVSSFSSFTICVLCEKGLSSFTVAKYEYTCAARRLIYIHFNRPAASSLVLLELVEQRHLLMIRDVDLVTGGSNLARCGILNNYSTQTPSA